MAGASDQQHKDFIEKVQLKNPELGKYYSYSQPDLSKIIHHFENGTVESDLQCTSPQVKLTKGK